MINTFQKNLIIFLVSIIIGIFFSLKQVYGNDHDIVGLDSTYINLSEKGIYNPSRFY